MAKTRDQKDQIIIKLVDGFSKAKSAVFVDFEGLNVGDIQSFRQACRENGMEYFVAKKTLLRLAMEKSKLSEVDTSQYNKGIGTVFGYTDEVTPAQVVDNFASSHEAMGILGGVMMENPEGKKSLNVESIKTLAKLPSKEVLLGQVVGTINAPISGFVNVLAGNIRGLINSLNAIKEQKI